MPGRKAKPLNLTEEERERLKALVRAGNTPQKFAFRARIILLSDEGLPNQRIAERLNTTNPTVCHWRKRFFQARLDGLGDLPRSGAPRTISDEKVAEVIEKTLQHLPKGQTHWSTRSMAKEADISRSTISRIWRAFGLKPHRHETFQLSTDPLFVEKVKDVVGLYMSPPIGAVVLCLDEKPQVQALSRTQPVVPTKAGQVERQTSEYKRHGTTNLFAALDVATGQVVGRCYERKRAVEFRDFLDIVCSGIEEGLEVHVVLDNQSIHKAPPVQKWLQVNSHVHLHFTPTHSSWLNLIEGWFSKLSRQQLSRGVHRSVHELIAAIEDFVDATNGHPKPFTWTKTPDQIFERLVRFCQRTLDAHTHHQV